MVVHVDNQGAIALAKNPVFNDRPKHINTLYHSTRGLVKTEEIGLSYLPTQEMLANLPTKPLPRGQHGFPCEWYQSVLISCSNRTMFVVF